MRILTILILWLMFAGPVQAWQLVGSGVATTGGGNTISFINSATATAGPDNADYIDVDVPTGTADGDIMIATVITDTYANEFPTITGWTLLNTATGGSNFRGALWYRTASSEPSNYRFNAALTNSYVAIINTYRKTGGTWNIAANSMTDPTDYGPTFTTDSISGVANGMLHIAFYNDGLATISTPPADMSAAGGLGANSVSIFNYYETTTASSYQKSITFSNNEQRASIQLVLEAQ